MFIKKRGKINPQRKTMGKQKPFYILYLENELQRRIDNNCNYSLRAFAKSLEIDASFLSKILLRKQPLALKKAEHLAQKLHLQSSQRKKFILSIADDQKCFSLKKVDGDLTDCK
ncbi:hypothetical protein [Candidatus Uabimicrobium sp. HlEnr_7]|uniref:hypothetical protein n=1 Tax=Candidatus Uabimicrobium helgolandensis TaxID=3095367 RepID=UPI003556CD9C